MAATEADRVQAGLVVDEFYRMLFLREPDAAGRKFWADKLVELMDVYGWDFERAKGEIHGKFLEHPEYKNRTSAGGSGMAIKRFYKDSNSYDNIYDLATGQQVSTATFAAAGGKAGDWETGQGPPSASLVSQYKAQAAGGTTTTGTTTTTTAGDGIMSQKVTLPIVGEVPVVVAIGGGLGLAWLFGLFDSGRR